MDNVLISATGYTGAGGVEIYFEDKDGAADKIWDAIFEAGKAGAYARSGWRQGYAEAGNGLCLYGNDIDDHTSPLEAGLGWITKFTKEFISRPRFEKQRPRVSAASWLDL